MSDDNQSKVQPAIVNFSARFEREVSEIEVLLTTLTSTTKAAHFKEIQEKLDLMYRGLGVLMDQEKDLSRKQKAEIQLLQRHIQRLKLILETEALPKLLAMLQSLRKQVELVVKV